MGFNHVSSIIKKVFFRLPRLHYDGKKWKTNHFWVEIKFGTSSNPIKKFGLKSIKFVIGDGALNQLLKERTNRV